MTINKNGFGLACRSTSTTSMLYDTRHVCPFERGLVFEELRGVLGNVVSLCNRLYWPGSKLVDGHFSYISSSIT